MPRAKAKPLSEKDIAKEKAKTGARLFLRLDFGGRPILGGGKVRLMEMIDAKGSISAAGRAMGMSYRRAWLLIEDLNTTFGSPLVTARTGGDAGGGATLTAKGKEIVALYRTLEQTATNANATTLRTLEKILRA